MRYRWKHSGAPHGVPTITLTDAGGPHTLEAVVAPALGGNIVALRYDGTEMLHRGGDMSPEPRGGWDGKAPLLWPAVGRQRYGAYSWPPGGSGGRHPMPVHGFAKDASFIVVSTSASETGGVKLCLRLHWRDVAEHAATYPFEYLLGIEYTLYQNALSVVHTVENCAAAGDLPFAIGNHLSLRFPFRGPAHAGWRSGTVTASTTLQHELDSGSLLSGATVDRSRELGVGKASPGMHLNSPGATDGVFGLPPPSVTAAATAATRQCWMALTQPGVLSVRVSHELRKPGRRPRAIEGVPEPWCEDAWRAAQDCRLFVLWGEPPPPPPPGGFAPLEDGEPGFLCVEPWQSGPDSLNTGKGLVVLGPTQRADWVFRLEIVEQ
jgi:galactose mutarotase-like enzyme